MHHGNININLMVENVTQIKSGIMVSVGVNVRIHKSIICVKNIILEMLLHVPVKMVDMKEVLLIIQWLSVMKL